MKWLLKVFGILGVPCVPGQFFFNNKPNKKGPKPSQSAPLKNDKGSKQKGKKNERHCNFCGKDNHDESKCLKKMAALEVAMKKHLLRPGNS